MTVTRTLEKIKSLVIEKQTDCMCAKKKTAL